MNMATKKLKHEAELFKAALIAGVKYAEGRKAVEFEATDSASQKLLYVYRLLVRHQVNRCPSSSSRRAGKKISTGSSRTTAPASCIWIVFTCQSSRARSVTAL